MVRVENLVISLFHYLAIASLAGLLRIIRLPSGGLVGRLTGMLSGLLARGPDAPDVPGAITIDAVLGFAGACAMAGDAIAQVNIKAMAVRFVA